MVDSGEQCDDGNLRSLDGCSSSCLREATFVAGLAFCGNGILEGAEQCDDGNAASGDGCSAWCAVEFTLTPEALSSAASTTATPVRGTQVAAGMICGNGVVEPGEECDDGNIRSLDGCSPQCFLEQGSCGDGILQRALDEQCEPSLHDPALPYACNPATCRFLSRTCGDGKVDLGEECDTGPSNSDAPGASCRLDCSRRRCGDGITDTAAGESCDDGNRRDGDGCSASCQRELRAPQTIVFAGSSSALPLYPVPFWPQGPTTATPWGLPYAQVQPLTTSRPPSGDTGPAAVLLMAAGAGAGLAYVRRRRG